MSLACVAMQTLGITSAASTLEADRITLDMFCKQAYVTSALLSTELK